MENSNDKQLFWGCFIALITTAFAFVTRLFLLGTWATEFNLDSIQVGRLAGIGIWPFAVSIIFFSLMIDRIGYKTAMYFSFLTYAVWVGMGYTAFTLRVSDPKMAYQLLYWGSLILGLGNGTIEAFINPVVATMFSTNKTKWLNILHAGWPGGLALAGIITIYIDHLPWGYKLAIIAVPAVIYLLMLIPCKFPVSERVASGVSYREMLQEFGIMGAAVVAVLVTLQLLDFASAGGEEKLSSGMVYAIIGIGVAMAVAFGIYTQSFGRAFMLVMIIIMIPLATTEIGTDGWITDIMKGVASESGFHPGWVLVYTSVIMMLLRFMAGPIVHTLSPLGLLVACSIFAICGLYWLSFSTGMMIFAAATLYGIGKTFFWPTMLGIVSEQCPKGGALTLNALGGIGMLAVGTLGTPFIGWLQDHRVQPLLLESKEVVAATPAIVKDGKLTVLQEKRIYDVIPYQAVNQKAIDAIVNTYPANTAGMTEEQIKAERDKVAAPIKKVQATGSQNALADMAMFPAFMLICYILLIVYFRTRGGYSAQVLTGHGADDKKFTGGVTGPIE